MPMKLLSYSFKYLKKSMNPVKGCSYKRLKV